MANVLTLEEIKNLANQVTDETFALNLIRGYANEAIAHINITLGSKLPAFPTDNTVVYIALDDIWLRTIVVNFVADRIKRNDGSLNEAMMYEQTWRLNLNTLKKEKRNYIADEYKGDNFTTTYANDPSKGLNLGWWHR